MNHQPKQIAAAQELVARAERRAAIELELTAKREIQPCMGYPHCNGGDEVCKNCNEAEDIRDAREIVAIAKIKKLGYSIEYNPPSIPQRNCDWQFAHDDYDGPGDHRCGCGPDPDACLVIIQELESE